MHWLLADRFPVDSAVIQQLLVGIKTLRPRIKVYPGIFTDSELTGIGARLYLLFGEREVLYSPCSAAERARRVIPEACVEIIPAAGHLLVMERPEFVNQRILGFLQRR